MKTKREVTLVQIMVVTSVLAIIAIAAIPNVFNARLTANETAAVRTLKYLAYAQESFRAELEHNEDGDDLGEYGTFGLLSGAVPTWKGRPADPAYLDERFKVEDPNAVVETKGYRFRLFLPDKVRKIEGQELTVVDEREGVWCAYGWPIEPGLTGSRVFFINEKELVYARPVLKMNLPVTDPGVVFAAEPFHSDPKLPEWSLVR